MRYFFDLPPNEPVCVKPVNPLPPNKMSDDTGNAALDGYTVLARASRYSGVRPSVDSVPYPEGPKQDY